MIGYAWDFIVSCDQKVTRRADALDTASFAVNVEREGRGVMTHERGRLIGTLSALGYGIAGLFHMWNAAHGPRAVIAFRLARPAAPILLRTTGTAPDTSLDLTRK